MEWQQKKKTHRLPKLTQEIEILNRHITNKEIKSENFQ